MASYRYYLVARPASPGAIPSKDIVAIKNYDARIIDPNAGRPVWGYVDYAEPLTKKELEAYEMIEGRK